MQISEHFTYKELTKSHSAIRNGIKNHADEHIIANACLVAKRILEPVRKEFNTPFTPSSWFRSEALEGVLCKDSYHSWCNSHHYGINDESWRAYFNLKSHPKGEAVDFEIPLASVSNLYLFEWIEANIPNFDQLLLEYYDYSDPHSGWVHVSFSRKFNRHDARKIK
jgi:zinc D-Ala-D-Ala carboxypeptidase